MLVLKLALRTLARRKGRMALIGALVAFGTFLIVFGTTFAASAGQASRESIIDNFTGDFIVYSARSKDLPSPFAFNTPLPRIRDLGAVEAFLAAEPAVEAFTPYAQNYGIVQAERDGKKVDLPFIFYAVEPESYARVFGAVPAAEGSYFGGTADGEADGRAANAPESPASSRGVMISVFQNEQYRKNYGVELRAGEAVTLLGVTEGGVNTIRSSVVGLFQPVHYTSVFNYINFMDAATFSSLYAYAGVAALPKAFEDGLAMAELGEDAIFGLAGDAGVSGLDLATLEAVPLSGATMIAVRLKDRGAAEALIARLEAEPGLEVKVARWDAASGFYSQIAAGLQAFIFLATGLVFLVVALIFMNTLIINVTERTAEIGTMRAIGTERSFVSALFVAEALILNLAAALLGMLLSGLALLAFARSGIPLPELVSQFLIGGGPLPLRPSLPPFLAAFGVVAAVSVLATLYPVRVAASITPLKAMNDR